MLETMDSLMLAGEKFGSAMHVGIVLILTPPADVDPAAYVDQLYNESLLADRDIDPRLRRRPHRGADTGGVWVWREGEQIDIHQHVHRGWRLPRGPAPPISGNWSPTYTADVSTCRCRYGPAT